MRRFLIAVVSCGLLASSAFAEPLGGRLEKFSADFNAAAKSLKVPTRIAKSSCGGEVRASCTFVVTDNITVIAASMPDKTTLGDVTIHMDGRPSEIPAYFQTVDVLIKLYAPKATADERRVILRQLVQQIADKPAPKVTIDGLEVSVLLVPGVASLTSVNRGDIGLDTTAEPLFAD